MLNQLFSSLGHFQFQNPKYAFLAPTCLDALSVEAERWKSQERQKEMLLHTLYSETIEFMATKCSDAC